MDFLKALFESGAITWEQFVEGVNKAGYKLADLSTGNYVAKKKYDDDLKTRDTQIETLGASIKTRDADLKNLQTQLADAGESSKTIEALNNQITKLQGDYKTAEAQYKAELGKQEYRFAVTEFANTQNFSSKAAKKTFINDMLEAQLKMNKGTIIGASDYLEAYKADNSDSFVTENAGTPNETGQQNDKPIFIQPTPQGQAQAQGEANPFDSLFNFAGVR